MALRNRELHARNDDDDGNLWRGKYPQRLHIILGLGG